MLTDSNGYIRMVNLTEFYATGTYIYNDSSQSNYTTFNPYTFFANTSTSGFNWTGTNTTNVVSSEIIVVLLDRTETLYIDFMNQTPSDLDSLSFGTLNVTYNVSNSSAFNQSSMLIYFKINSTILNEFMIFENGTGSSGWQNMNISGSAGANYWFSLLNNEFLPATYNYPEDSLENTPKNHTTLSRPTHYALIKLMNISTQKNYSFFEINVFNVSFPASSLRLYVCNVSYVPGKSQTSSYCTQFCTIKSKTPFNHTHSPYSNHHVCPIAINTTTQSIRNLVVTDNMSFLVRGPVVGQWNISFINNISRIGANQNSTDAGNSWVNLSGTYDAHVHQFNGNETFWYYSCGNLSAPNEDTGNCTPVRYDLLQLGGLPPMAPDVYLPIEAVYSTVIEINWTVSISPNGYPITIYNVSLLNLDETFNKTIVNNWSPNLNFSWDISGEANGTYIIEVNACDNNSLCAAGLSENFTINITPSSFTQTNYSWTQDTNITSSTKSNWSFIVYTDGSGLVNVSLLMNRSGSLYIINGSGSYIAIESNGSTWIAWNTYNNISQNWTIIENTGTLNCYPVSHISWTGKTNASICELTQPFYSNYTASMNIPRPTGTDETPNVYICTGSVCEKTLSSHWTRKDYTYDDNVIYATDILNTPIYYLMAYDIVTGIAGTEGDTGGGGTVVITTSNETKTIFEIDTGEIEEGPIFPIRTLGDLKGVLTRNIEFSVFGGRAKLPIWFILTGSMALVLMLAYKFRGDIKKMLPKPSSKDEYTELIE
ncbi:hypothetical protein DRJ17_06520 [Candidatus Woesearchaeota archaeon]|nr:MAG: hypothetical protein DRJ17_06520 [Candidatus Woesearchaeota archaeon]